MSAQFDPEFIARYDVSGPRYTSYPTAPQFHEGFGEAELHAAALISNWAKPARALSLYLHVPFCLNPCFYCGCTRIITRDRQRAATYLEYLEKEMSLVAPMLDRTRVVEQLHLGGGTPNFLNKTQMAALLEALARNFNLSEHPDREFGIELDPRHCDPSYAAMLVRHGFNRFSIGVQDFAPEVQQAINRVQSLDRVRDLCEAGREHGVRSISMDLIYGLPKQNVATFSQTLDTVIALKPDRIACYAYAHLPERFRAQRQIKSDHLPDAAARLKLLGLTVRKLEDAGYRYVGMDHFALPSDELVLAQDSGTLQRNFQGYSTHADCDLIGLGMTSISHIGPTFSQNERDLASYYAALDAGRLPVARGLELAEDDLIRADVIQRLMCDGQLAASEFHARHGLNFDAYFTSEQTRLRELQDDGLIRIDAQGIQVTPRGRFLLRNVAMCFDTYLSRADTAPVKYSRAV